MSKLRSVSTAFWSDPFIEELTPNQKLLFLYLITNEKTNMLGIYESSIKKISFETGIIEKTILSDLKHFELKNKVRYVNNYVILLNFMKHQNFNTNMMKSAIDVYNALPNELKDSNIVISKDDPLKGFEILCNHFGMVRKIEVEVEYELEDKDKSIYRKFAHLSITNKEVEKLKETYKIEEIDEILDRIENHKNRKNYVSLYLTSINWLKEHRKRVNNQTQKPKLIEKLLEEWNKCETEDDKRKIEKFANIIKNSKHLINKQLDCNKDLIIEFYKAMGSAFNRPDATIERELLSYDNPNSNNFLKTILTEIRRKHV